MSNRVVVVVEPETGPSVKEKISLPPRSTVWDLDDHTRGKHLVLRSYMDAWLPIVLNTYERALFVDGFAGPGEYRRGEPGSPPSP